MWKDILGDWGGIRDKPELIASSQDKNIAYNSFLIKTFGRGGKNTNQFQCV